MKTDMNFDDATLMAYADGELDAAARAAVENAMVANPDLAARVAGHSALRSRLRSAYDPILTEPVPKQLLRQLETEPMAPRSDSITSLEVHRIAKVRPARRWSWPEWGAMAASVAIGLVVGQQVLQPGVPVVARDGMFFAAGPLAAALSEQLAGLQNEAGSVQLGISFRNHDGNYCRTFQIAAGSAGFACRQGTDWRVKLLTENEGRVGEPGNYRLAAASLPAAVLSAVEAAIDGDPLDADDEVAARNAGWR